MRKLVLGILCFTALLLLGYAGFRSYETWKQKHLLSMAHDFAAKSDLTNARLSLTELLRVNPLNIEATRMMGDLSEPDQLSDVLFWRERAVELAPHSSDDRLALAAVALQLRELTTAATALDGIQESHKNTAAYHSMAGSLAAAANQFAVAEAHFREAIRLEPQNPGPQLSLAVIRLHETNAIAMAEGRDALSRLSSNPTNASLRCQAIRELAIDAIHHHQPEASLALSKRLVEETNAVFTDRLLRLQAFFETQNAELKVEMSSLEREAQEDPAKIQEMVMWQLGKIPPDQSLAWLRSLPSSTQTNPPVARLKAECYVALQDWPGLQACVETGNWGELEAARHAYKARALRGEGSSMAAEGEWKQALHAASGQEATLVQLSRLAAHWNWASESDEILRAIVHEYPNEEWARQALAQSLFATGQTLSLLRLYSQQAKLSPSDLAAKNNVAMTALLLRAEDLNPRQIALELYQESPTNSSFAATYAFSLFQQGKKTEALQVLDRLDPPQLETACVAPCYGILLEATGNHTKAKRYLDLASKIQMLPEERELVDSAKRELEQSGTPKS
jgi:predicted Zn-dependent protease